MPAIKVESVSKSFKIYQERHDTLKEAVLFRGRTRYETLWVLKDVSFEVPTGQTVGFIGENGSGKSTLLKMFAGIYKPEAGEITVSGKISALLELGAGFHPDLTGRENIYLNGAILRVPRRRIDEIFDSIVDFSGLREFINTPVKNYSSGMYTRLGFAVAISVEPDVLLVDEVLAVGDQAFQNKCYERIYRFKKEGKTIAFVSHDLNAIEKICDRVIFIDKGKIVADGDPAKVVGQYLDFVSDKDVKRDRSGFTSRDGSRVGTGEAEIVKVTMINSAGKNVAQIGSGETATVRLEVLFHQDVFNPTFGISIRAADNTYLYDVNNQRRGHKSGPFKKGTRVFVDFTEDFRLLGGEYTVSAAVAHADESRFCDHRGYVLSFSVRDDRRDRGLVDLSAKVKISDAVSGQTILEC